MKQPKAKAEAARTTSMHRLTTPKPHASQARDMKRGTPTPERPLIVSASELSEFLRCRVRHHWSSQLQLTSIKPSVPRSMGTVGHQTLEHWYKLAPAKRTTKAMRKLADTLVRGSNLKELTTEDRELLTAMVTGYADWCMSPDTDHNDPQIGLGVCEPEAWFEENIVADGSIRVRGKIDNLFASTTMRRTMGMLESKFKARIEDVEDNRLQDNVYLWAMRRRYPKVKRYVLFYQILRKQMPGPRVTAALYHRELVERTDDELDQFELDMQRIALDMVDAAVYPNRNGQCKWDCDFKVPCLLRGSPEDLEHVLATEFTKRVRT